MKISKRGQIRIDEHDYWGSTVSACAKFLQEVAFTTKRRETLTWNVTLHTQQTEDQTTENRSVLHHCLSYVAPVLVVGAQRRRIAMKAGVIVALDWQSLVDWKSKKIRSHR